jgi:hypothetical protein
MNRHDNTHTICKNNAYHGKTHFFPNFLHVRENKTIEWNHVRRTMAMMRASHTFRYLVTCNTLNVPE